MSRTLSRAEEITNEFINERVAYLLPIFEGLAPCKVSDRKKGRGDLPGWHALAIQEARILKINYPDERPEAEKEYGTCLRQITALKKELKLAAKSGLKDPMLFNQVNTIITNFGNALSDHFASYKLSQNIRYREKVKERRQPENRIEIDLTNSLKFCFSVLTDINGGKSANWMDVSSALALATGRRMAEIHLAASFEKVSDYEVIFRGHLKGKSRKMRVGDQAVAVRDYPFMIPTLLPADLVCFGLQWLDEKGKRFPTEEDPERVNRRWSKVLNEHVKEFDIFPVDDRTYHKFRAAYLRACVENNPALDEFDFTDYAEKILGDKDETTIESYKRYKIKSGSLTKI
jgi:hypothetical protein